MDAENFHVPITLGRAEGTDYPTPGASPSSSNSIEGPSGASSNGGDGSSASDGLLSDAERPPGSELLDASATDSDNPSELGASDGNMSHQPMGEGPPTVPAARRRRRRASRVSRQGHGVSKKMQWRIDRGNYFQMFSSGNYPQPYPQHMTVKYPKNCKLSVNQRSVTVTEHR